MSTSSISVNLRLAVSCCRLWPFERGRSRIYRILVKIFPRWRAFGSFSFRFGRFSEVSMDVWPQGYRELFIWGEMDHFETLAWRQVIRKDDVVIDGGANMGYYTLVAATLVGKNGHVHSFEPIPATVQALKANILSSEKRNVTVHESALSDFAGKTEFILYANDIIGVQSSAEKRENLVDKGVVTCENVTLDSIAASHSIIPTLLKLDVEGSELPALRGAEKTISSAKPIIVFEWSVLTAKSAGYEPGDILKYLSRWGYRPYRANHGRFTPLAQTAAVEGAPMIWCFCEGPLRDRVKKHMDDR